VPWFTESQQSRDEPGNSADDEHSDGEARSEPRRVRRLRCPIAAAGVHGSWRVITYGAALLFHAAELTAKYGPLTS
jgi:hypothetical protein